VRWFLCPIYAANLGFKTFLFGPIFQDICEVLTRQAPNENASRVHSSTALSLMPRCRRVLIVLLRTFRELKNSAHFHSAYSPASPIVTI
jgi:hypothetical protein